MAWEMAIPALAGAGVGVFQDYMDHGNRQDAMRIEAMRQRYQPLLGRHGETMQQTNPWAKPTQGALQGAAFAQSNKGLWDSKKSDTPSSGEALAQLYGYGPTQDKARAMQMQQQQMTPWQPLY